MNDKEKPSAWKLVPVELTAAMINAWSGGLTVTSDEVAYRTPFQDAWRRLLAAAPHSRPSDAAVSDERALAARPTMVKKSSFCGVMTDERILFERTVAPEYPDMPAHQIEFAWWLWQAARSSEKKNG
jgi:hypothetical protein